MQKKVLIVDDEKDALTMLEERLLAAGYLVIKAQTGKDAIALAREEHPSLIMLDIIMPLMSGDEIADILKNDPETKDIPIIFLTCIITKQEERKERVIAGRYFIAKPYNPNEMLKVVKEFTGSTPA